MNKWGSWLFLGFLSPQNRALPDWSTVAEGKVLTRDSVWPNTGGPHSLALSPASGACFDREVLAAGERELSTCARTPGRCSLRSLALGYSLWPLQGHGERG